LYIKYSSGYPIKEEDLRSAWASLFSKVVGLNFLELKKYIVRVWAAFNCLGTGKRDEEFFWHVIDH
jgi:hypothetical protein